MVDPPVIEAVRPSAFFLVTHIGVAIPATTHKRSYGEPIRRVSARTQLCAFVFVVGSELQQTRVAMRRTALKQCACRENEKQKQRNPHNVPIETTTITERCLPDHYLEDVRGRFKSQGDFPCPPARLPLWRLLRVSLRLFV